ncbi:pentapeptide repeat-containing protein [Aneurinibacillus uraniidurans]|uniref:pentapeptide repeat-containing protein n=1 Tax=Aneurinibacillus uraniidurans TaxID=2966586 RepID=UPI00234A3EA3|nr:pentapeptide repeat-containing protein [Aneurinibacillus sp. B1]WCN36417.1 pentapeptide repeat-containing protein [Aneurinibacillus sp. B1]
MRKEEALARFIEEVAQPKSQETVGKLEQHFHRHKDEHAEAFIRSFQLLCRRIQTKQAQGEKGKIGYITYSMLRTEMMEGRYYYLIDASDRGWFFDRMECQEEYDASWAFHFLDVWGYELEREAKAYMGKITVPDIERLKRKEAKKYNAYMVSLARYAMPQALQVAEYREIKKEEELEVRVGEYLDSSEVVYKEDTREKDASVMKEWLEEKEEGVYAYEVFANLDLFDGEYAGIDLRYTDVRHSTLSHSNLCQCVLVGTNFMKACLEGANFSSSLIHEANFGGSNLRGAIFHQVEGVRGLLDSSDWTRPGFQAVNFAGADLSGADFSGANLTGAVFTGAKLTDTNFTGANVEQAQFSEKDRDTIVLDDRQRAGVIWRS